MTDFVSNHHLSVTNKLNYTRCITAKRVAS